MPSQTPYYLNPSHLPARFSHIFYSGPVTLPMWQKKDCTHIRRCAIMSPVMPFPEKVKLAVRRHSHFRCCVCQTPYAEAHHIIPDGEGPDTEDNAAPLCPNCHTQYGNDPKKRKWIRQARDWWYEVCDKRYTTSPEEIEQMRKQWDNAATKADVDEAVNQLTNVIQTIGAVPGRSAKEVAQEISDITTSVTSMVSVAPLSWGGSTCGRCGSTWPWPSSTGETAEICPKCGCCFRI